jgi:hypothetical protein
LIAWDELISRPFTIPPNPPYRCKYSVKLYVKPLLGKTILMQYEHLGSRIGVLSTAISQVEQNLFFEK